MSQHYLDRLFQPRSIALLGASARPESVGGRVFENLMAGGFKGPIYPINPKRKEINGIPTFPTIADIGKPVDLAVVATPATTVPGILRQCGEYGIRHAIVLSAGFGEGAGAGADLMKSLLQEVHRYGLHLIGPNCLGVISPHIGMNATFSKNQAQPGSLALVSQSGALCTGILDWAEVNGVGFSSLVSLGSMADVEFGQVLDYLALDANTKSILLYVEGIRDARRFMGGLRVAARFKPVIVVKAGRHEAGSKAAMSHTGSLVGADDVFDAALRRTGVVRAMTIEQLFAAAELLARHSGVGGSRLGVVTNAGGPGVLAADRAAELDVALPSVTDATMDKLNEVLPESWSHGNPVDILGDATPERYEKAISVCLEDPQMDGVLVILTPQAMTDPTAVAEGVVKAAEGAEKPVLTCWMGGAQVKAGRDLLTKSEIPEFPSPETSVEAFSYLANYRHSQKLLVQVPGPVSQKKRHDVDGARLIIEGALSEGRSTLSTTESKAVLSAFGIPMDPSVEARSANEALVAAQTVGFPVAMKINSPQITHKSDVGGVRLNIGNAHDVRSVYTQMVAQAKEVNPQADVRGVTVEHMYGRSHGREILVGVFRDPVFGPVVTFGAGGTAVEIMRDRAVALPPLNSFIAEAMIKRTRVSKLLEKFRNMPAVNREALIDVLLKISDLVCELPHVHELDINPLMADPEGVSALDARIVVGYPEPQVGPYGHMAIHPYPAQLESRFQLTDGTDITIRPIRPEDAEMEAEFHRNLSPEAKYFRFMQSKAELTLEMLVRFTQIDYDREMAFIATKNTPKGEVELAVGRYVANPDGESCEFAIVVADEWRRRGVGSRIMGALIESARSKGMKRIEGEILASNEPMIQMMERLGFRVTTSEEDPQIRVCQLNI